MRTEKLRDAYQRLVDAGFTGQEVYAAGPLFNPEHPTCTEAQFAMHLHRVIGTVERKHNELLSQLVHAQQDVKEASAFLYNARLHRGSKERHGYVQAQLALEDRRIRICELAVLNAHDKLWAAQRMLQLFDFTYGPTGGIT